MKYWRKNKSLIKYGLEEISNVLFRPTYTPKFDVFIFCHVLNEYIPRYQFDKLVKQYKGDWHTKNLSSYNHLFHLLFGQLTGCDSLRHICLCLEALKTMLYHLGFIRS